MGKKTILIIEDSPTQRILYNFELTKAGYDTILSDNGVTGLELAKEKIPDLILVDVMLPGINGFDVCKRLKENDDTKYIPIIIVSALSQQENINKGMEAGALHYFVKTNKFHELENKIVETIGR